MRGGYKGFFFFELIFVSPIFFPQTIKKLKAIANKGITVDFSKLELYHL